MLTGKMVFSPVRVYGSTYGQKFINYPLKVFNFDLLKQLIDYFTFLNLNSIHLIQESLMGIYYVPGLG